MILGVFARPNHPRGYGQCGGTLYGQVHSAGTAHGYIVFVVLSEDIEEHLKVTAALGAYREPFRWPTRGDDWYAGPYEPVWSATVDAPPEDAKRLGGMPFAIGEALSYGDNRACAYLTAAEVLEA